MEKVDVLLIEDEIYLLEIMQLQLKRAGLNVKTATNGKVAIEQLQGFQPRLIITDLLMPEMGGADIIKEIREVLGLETSVIIMTGGTRSDISDVLSRYKNLTFLEKPILPKDLLTKVAQLLGQ